MRSCRATNGENNMDVNVARHRQDFCMPCGIKIWSPKCRSHQMFAMRHMMSKGFKIASASWRKKSDEVHRSRSTVFVTWSIVCEKFVFNVYAITLAAYVEQLLPHGKAAVCCILPRSIMWMHLKVSILISRKFYWFLTSLARIYTQQANNILMTTSVNVN